jgi:hypothetical protein
MAHLFFRIKVMPLMKDEKIGREGVIIKWAKKECVKFVNMI